MNTMINWDGPDLPRVMADLTGNGRADIVGFGYAGVWTALSNGDGSFTAPAFVTPDLGANQGWRPATNPVQIPTPVAPESHSLAPLGPPSATSTEFKDVMGYLRSTRGSPAISETSSTTTAAPRELSTTGSS